MFSTVGQRSGTFEAAAAQALAERVPLLADPDGVLAQLGPERLFYMQDALEGTNINVVHESLEAPADALPAHAERLVDLLAVRAAEHHVARLARAQLDPELTRFHQLLQLFQKLRVLLGQLHD